MNLLYSPRYWGAALSFSVTVANGLCHNLYFGQSLFIAFALILGLWFGGLLPLWINLIRAKTLSQVRKTRREWTGALLVSLLCVTIVGFAVGQSIIECLAIAAPGLTFAYAGGKLGCYRFGCCDWSARFFVENWSLPKIEAAASILLGSVLSLMSCHGFPDRIVLLAGALGLGIIRQCSLYFRDEPVFYLKSIKVDGLLLLLVAQILALGD